LAVKDRQLRSRYLSWIFFGLAIASQQTVFALYMGDVFGFEAHDIGWLFAAMGLVMAVNQGYLLSRFWLKRFSEDFLEVWLLPVLAFGFLAFASHRAWLFIIGMVINGLTQTIVRAITTSRVAGLAGQTKRGEVMGIMSSIMAFTMFVSPIIAGYLYAVDYSWPFYYGAFAVFMAAIAIKCCPLESKKVVDSQNMEDTEIISA
jgi:DHA1 family quinolone resistance protein-like MFS transporter